MLIVFGLKVRIIYKLTVIKLLTKKGAKIVNKKH